MTDRKIRREETKLCLPGREERKRINGLNECCVRAADGQEMRVKNDTSSLPVLEGRRRESKQSTRPTKPTVLRVKRFHIIDFNTVDGVWSGPGPSREYGGSIPSSRLTK